MAAPTSFPSYAYNPFQPPVIVQNLTAFNALPGPGTWGTQPFASTTPGAPFDPGFTDTDIRLQQILIENRITNQMLQFGFNLVDDPVTQIRPDVLANDSGLGT
jgi:hypothetical protein